MASSPLRVAILFLAVSVAGMLLFFNLGGRFGLLLGLGLAIVCNMILFFFGRNPLLRWMQAEELRGQDPWGIQNIVKRLAANLHLPIPKIFYVSSSGAFSFHLRTLWQEPSICLSQGLIFRMSSSQLEAVLAHHLLALNVQNRVWITALDTLAHALVEFANSLDRIFPSRGGFRRLVLPLSWLMIRAGHGPRRHLQIDLLQAEQFTQREVLAQVLWRMHGLAQTMPQKTPALTEYSFLVHPRAERKNQLLGIHAPIDRRLEKIIGYYPI